MLNLNLWRAHIKPIRSTTKLWGVRAAAGAPSVVPFANADDLK